MDDIMRRRFPASDGWLVWTNAWGMVLAHHPGHMAAVEAEHAAIRAIIDPLLDAAREGDVWEEGGHSFQVARGALAWHSDGGSLAIWSWAAACGEHADRHSWQWDPMRDEPVPARIPWQEVEEARESALASR